MSKFEAQRAGTLGGRSTTEKHHQTINFYDDQESDGVMDDYQSEYDQEKLVGAFVVEIEL